MPLIGRKNSFIPKELTVSHLTSSVGISILIEYEPKGSSKVGPNSKSSQYYDFDFFISSVIDRQNLKATKGLNKIVIEFFLKKSFPSAPHRLGLM